MALRVVSAFPEAASGKVIGTHDGHFHCDEALACAMLRLTDEYGGDGVVVVRTRNPGLLQKCNVVVDVGGEYDADRGLLDHHQPSFRGTMATAEAEYATRLSSAGLVYKHFGRGAILGALRELDQTQQQNSQQLTAEQLEVVYDRLYKYFVEHVDGIDNGVEEFALAPGSPAAGASLVQNYRATTGLSARIGRLNPKWNEPSSAEHENGQFAKAVRLAGEEFREHLQQVARVWLPARTVVERAVADRAAVHPSGGVIELATPCPWQEHLFDIEERAGIAGQVLYVLFPDSKGGWRIQCVGVKGTKFQNRRSLPRPWRGLRDAELSTASGVPGGVFVHVSGFIGGNNTREGVLQMAAKALEAPEADVA